MIRLLRGDIFTGLAVHLEIGKGMVLRRILVAFEGKMSVQVGLIVLSENTIRAAKKKVCISDYPINHLNALSLVSFPAPLLDSTHAEGEGLVTRVEFLGTRPTEASL